MRSGGSHNDDILRNVMRSVTMVLDFGLASPIWDTIIFAISLAVALWLYRISFIMDHKTGRSWRILFYAAIIYAVISLVLIFRNLDIISFDMQRSLTLPLRVIFTLMIAWGIWEQMKLFNGMYNHKARRKRR